MSTMADTPLTVPDGGSMRRRPKDAELFERFAAYLVEELGRSPRTAHSYVQAVKRGAAFAGKPVSKVNVADLRAVLRSDYAPATKRGIVVAYRQWHFWGHVEGLWKLGGLASIKTPKVVRHPLPPLRESDSKKALTACTSPLHYRLSFLGLYAGLRVSEVAQVVAESWQNGWIRVLGKGAKKRKIPVHSELEKMREEILSKHPSYRVLEVTWTRFRDRNLLKTVEQTKATTHTLRRTFASQMYGAGVPWEVVARLLGHGEDVTASYARIPDEALVEAVEAVNYYAGEPIQLTLF